MINFEAISNMHRKAGLYTFHDNKLFDIFHLVISYQNKRYSPVFFLPRWEYVVYSSELQVSFIYLFFDIEV